MPWEQYGTENNDFSDFPIGTKVKVITPCEDFTFFDDQTGTVIKNSGGYLGIKVEFDEVYAGMKSFNFNPKSLYKLPQLGTQSLLSGEVPNFIPPQDVPLLPDLRSIVLAKCTPEQREKFLNGQWEFDRENCVIRFLEGEGK